MGEKKISSIISLSPAGPQGERWPGEGALWPLVGCHPHPTEFSSVSYILEGAGGGWCWF